MWVPKNKAKKQPTNELRSWEVNFPGLLIEFASFFCSTVKGDPFPDPRGRNKRGESLRDGAVDCHVTYKGRRKVKNSFTKHNIHSVIEEVD